MLQCHSSNLSHPLLCVSTSLCSVSASPLIAHFESTSPSTLKGHYKWPKSVWKDAQHHWSSDKCKSKSKWAITSYLLGWSLFEKKKENNEHLWGCRKIGTFMHCWWECKVMQLLWEKVQRLLKKLKMELPYDPNQFLGIYSKEIKSVSRRLPSSLQRYSQQLGGGSNPNVHQRMNG